MKKNSTKCAYCRKQAVRGVGKPEVWVCMEHFEAYLEKCFAPIKDLTQNAEVRP